MLSSELPALRQRLQQGNQISRAAELDGQSASAALLRKRSHNQPYRKPASPAIVTPAVYRWIKTACGRAKYQELAARPGPAARLRLAWFVAIAALRDWPLPPPASGSEA